jgi:hypothetical protein
MTLWFLRALGALRASQREIEQEVVFALTVQPRDDLCKGVAHVLSKHINHFWLDRRWIASEFWSLWGKVGQSGKCVLDYLGGAYCVKTRVPLPPLSSVSIR